MENSTSSNNSNQDDQTSSVDLWIYDLSRGFARIFSGALLGQQIDGVYHTSIVYQNQEYFYGAEGIVNCFPGGTVLGPPNEIRNLGRTELTQDIFGQYIDELKRTTYQGSKYDLFSHNCNNFTNDLGEFLVGVGIPSYILNIPEIVLNTSLGQVLQQFSKDLLPRQRGGADLPTDLPTSKELVNPLEIIIRERVLGIMSDSDEGTPQPVSRKQRDVVAEVEEEERREREEKKKNREPPIVYRDLGGSIEALLDEFEKSLSKVDLNDEEVRCMRELREYALGDEGSWVLSDDFLNLIGRILLSSEDVLKDNENARLLCLKVLAWLAVTKDDVILVLHQDRRDHVLMRYASRIEELSPKLQEGVSLLLCNLFENLSTSEWLLYISEWENDGRGMASNIRVTTKVGVHALLSSDMKQKEIGAALLYNVLSKEVFDDVAVEMALALLQFLSERPPETLIWRGLKSLLRCCQLARSEVPNLVKMVGPSPNELKGTSERCDGLIQQLDAILTAS